MSTPDLLEVLAAIEADARRTRERIAAGKTLTGSTALTRIEARAQDAIRWALDPENGRPEAASA